MNPCPCGYSLEKVKRCQCPSALVLSYRRKLSGPLLDRLGLFVSLSLPGSSSKEIRKELTHAFITKSIGSAWKIQEERYQGNAKKNGDIAVVDEYSDFDLGEEESIWLEDIVCKERLSFR